MLQFFTTLIWIYLFSIIVLGAYLIFLRSFLGDYLIEILNHDSDLEISQDFLVVLLIVPLINTYMALAIIIQIIKIFNLK